MDEKNFSADCPTKVQVATIWHSAKLGFDISGVGELAYDCRWGLGRPVKLMLVSLLADVGVVRAVHVRGGHQLAVDLGRPDSTVVLVEKALQGLMSRSERPDKWGFQIPTRRANDALSRCMATRQLALGSRKQQRTSRPTRNCIAKTQLPHTTEHLGANKQRAG